MLVLIRCVYVWFDFSLVFGYNLCYSLVYILVVGIGNWTVRRYFHTLFFTIGCICIGGLASWVLMIEWWCTFIRSSVNIITTFVYIMSLFLILIIVAQDTRLFVLILILKLILVLMLLLMLDSLCFQLSFVMTISIAVIISSETCW